MDSHIRSVDNYLKKIPDQGNYEFEIRFGEFKFDYGTRRSKFISSIEPKIFYRLLKYFGTLEDIYDYIPQQVSIQTNNALNIKVPSNPDLITEHVYVDPNNPYKRVRESFISEITNGPKFYNTKEKVEYIDNEAYNQRFSIAYEEDLGERSVPSSANLQALREKKRWSFAVNKELAERSEWRILANLQIDLTHVTGWFNDNGKKVQVNDFEFEAEIVKKPFNYEKDVFPGIVFLIQLYQNTCYLIDTNETRLIFNQFNKLFEKDIQSFESEKQKQNERWQFSRSKYLFNPVNKPVNLKLEHLENIDNLVITDKADGERKLLFFTQSGIYAVYPPRDIIKISNKPIPGFSNTLLDGELVKSSDGCSPDSLLFLGFDLLFYRGEDRRDISFTDRINKLPKLTVESDIIIEPKKFYSAGNFYSNVNTLLNKISEKSEKRYGNDGIIINQKNGVYLTPVYKWKPVDLLTIDFYVRKVDKNIYELLVKSGSGLERFIGTDEHRFSGFLATDEPLNTGQIVEMAWDGETFKLKRIRDDRDQPNNKSTSISIWNDIMRPIEETTIRGKNLVMLRYLHNKIKKSILEECREKYLLDIGSGRGGDLHKWKSSKIKVYAVEPSLEHIKEFRDRLLESGYVFDEQTSLYKFKETQVKILNTVGQDTEKIVAGYNETFDVLPSCITLFNSLTFFFESEESLDSLINTIDNLLSPGGSFMGMVMDGYTVRKLLGVKDKVEVEDSWTISKLTEFTESPYGNKIYINLNDTIVQNQEEYLVDFSELVRKLEQRGIFLEKSELLTNDNLSPSQTKLYSLYRTFKFKRSGNAPEQISSGEIIRIDKEEKQNLYTAVESTHLQSLREEQTAAIIIENKQFIRIGVRTRCMIEAIARNCFTPFQKRMNDVEFDKIDFIQTLTSKIITRLEPLFKQGDLLTEFSTWEDASSFLSCKNIHWFNLLDAIGKAFSTNIIHVKYYDSIKKPEITTTNIDNVAKFIIIFNHDNQFEAVSDSNSNTIFTQNPLI